ncbi:MAG: sulfurtransferase complex subunit TusB [Gammaproteobacteria bacterium]|nr:sulfurtransferase complex subunit TusB [Gammaproteobacteria bacterium]
MAMLHTVNKSPFEKDSLESCIRNAKAGSAILLIEDGVYGALNGTKITDLVQSAMASVSFYALSGDLEARGVRGKVMENIELVDYAGFVELVAKHDSTTSWL